MKKDEKVYSVTDEMTAGVEASREKGKFKFIRKKIEKLKEKNLPVYWDILYEGLTKGGDWMFQEYLKRFGKEHYYDLENQNDIAYLYEKFRVIYVPNHSFKYNQKFVKRNEDGSFELNPEAVDNHFQELYTYTISEEQYHAVQSILNGFKVIGYSTRGRRAIVDCLYKDKNGEMSINELKLYCLLSRGARSPYRD